MTAVAIHAENLSKQYRIGEPQRYKALRDSLADGFAAPIRAARRSFRPANGRPARVPTAIWALNDLSFDVHAGEVLGIIGRNGAGKSTLLKILSRVTEPTAGLVDIYGRVGSLLEVGTGFHPELTGRENIYLNAAILGMKRVEITRSFDEIVHFAEIEQFLDTPVKRYSSGMYLRLAFAVAAHLTPEILIVDEVLAVGDSAFQKKCLQKMGDVATAGRTVLFVSHNLNAIAQLTTRCLVLNKGTCVFDGPTADALRIYGDISQSDAGEPAYYRNLTPTSANHIAWAQVHTAESGGVQPWGEPIGFEFGLQVSDPHDSACLSFQVMNELQQPICHFWFFDTDAPYRNQAGLFRLRCEVPRLRLYMGRYTLTTWLGDPRGRSISESVSGICRFEVNMHNVRREEYDWAPGACAYVEDAVWSVPQKIGQSWRRGGRTTA